ncbi:uncharacterized protein isoform X2 [Musca autumnalis]
MKRQAEEQQNKELEALWLLRENLAQKQFQNEKEKRLAEEKAKAELLDMQFKQLQAQEAILQKQREIIEKQTEEAAKYLAEIAFECQQYLENPGMKTPTKLKILCESRPGQRHCEFYKKTHCCRFGAACGLNHIRPMLSRVIVIRNFFQHALFEKRVHKADDRQLEFSEEDLQKDYFEFCTDVWPELEQFGKIINFRTTRNRHPRGGHVFVEYEEKRCALKAFTNLQNRYYGGRQLSVEFSHVTYWRSALCGLALGRKCNKGDKCNYLHIFANPENKYNTKLEKIGKPKGSTTTNLNSTSKGDNFERGTSSSSRRNWRWSESPELEVPPPTTNTSEQEMPTSSRKADGKDKQKSPIVIISSSSSDDEEDTKSNIQIKSEKVSTTTKQKAIPHPSPKQESPKQIPESHKKAQTTKRNHPQSSNDMIMISSTSEDDSDIILIDNKTPHRSSRKDKSTYKHKYHKRKSSRDSSASSSRSSSAYSC